MNEAPILNTNLMRDWFDALPWPCLELTHDEQITRVNPRAALLLQGDSSEADSQGWIGKSLKTLFAEPQRRLISASHHAALMTSNPQMYELKWPCTPPRHFAVCVTPGDAHRGASCLYVLMEIAAHQQLEADCARVNQSLEKMHEQMRDALQSDSLTHTLNRRGIEQALSDERAYHPGRDLCAILLDCDNFHPINAVMGHASGDAVLATLAAMLKKTLRPCDSLARVGGDEFLALLPGLSLEAAQQMAERLRRVVSTQPLALFHGPVEVTMSICVTALSSHIANVADLLSIMRAHLRIQRGRGNNGVCMLFENMAERDLRTPLQHSLRAFLSGEERLLSYQHPIVSLTDGRLMGYELLTRGPVGLLHSPIDLFRIAIEERMLTAIDLRCFLSCMQAGDALPAGVWRHLNLYPSTLLETSIERLEALFPVPHSFGTYCIELSEQQMVGNPAHLLPHLTWLREAGVRIAIDDVGFGRTSLETLIVIEPEVVKIDRACVTGIAHDPVKRQHLKRLSTAMQALNCVAIAEGIETLEDMKVAIEFGIEYGQGYYWGKPQAIV